MVDQDAYDLGIVDGLGLIKDAIERHGMSQPAVDDLNEVLMKEIDWAMCALCARRTGRLRAALDEDS